MLLRVFKYLIARRRADAELEEEIRAHFAIDVRQRIDAGESPDEARDAARREFGNVLQIKEVTREMWGWNWVEHFAQDMRYAWRMLGKNPGFTVVAVLSLALGTGATTAVFGVFDAVVLKPMQVPQPDRLVNLIPQRNGRRWILVNPIFEALRERQQSMEGIFAAQENPHLKVRFEGDAAPSYMRASVVSGAYFRVLGLQPPAGRFIAEEDDQIPGTTGNDQSGNDQCAAVVSYSLWERRFRNDPGAIGRRLQAGNRHCTIVGVAPPGFRSHQAGFESDLWVPMRQMISIRDLRNRYGAFFSGVAGRLKEGVTAAQAQAELTAVFQQIQAAEPLPPPDIPDPPIPAREVGIRVVPGGHGFRAIQSEFEKPLQLILMLVATVLLISSANVAGLILARGASRSSELATRAAIGAGRGRLARQLLTEGSLLAALGGIFGIVIARLGAPVLASFISVPWLPIAIHVELDARLFLAAFTASAVAALLASAIPAWRLSQSRPQAAMANGARTTGAVSGNRLGRGLVVAQLTLSFALTIATGLMLRTVWKLSSVNPGFRPDHVLTLEVYHEVPKRPAEEGQGAELAAIYETVEHRLSSIPGVIQASLSWLQLFGGSDQSLQIFDPASPDRKQSSRIDYVTSRYFETAGMTMRRGRSFEEGDREAAPKVAIVNEALVRARFGNAEAIGRQIGVARGGGRNPVFTIAGVVADSKYNGLRETGAQPMIWLPLAQAPQPIRSVMLRVQAGSESAVARQAQAVLQAADANIILRRSTTLKAFVEGSTSRERLILDLAIGFAGLALLLAAVGVYGTLSFAVASRTREIGLRLALGADPRRLMMTVVGRALRLTLWAVAIGLPLAIAAGASLRSYLFGIEVSDAGAICGACVVLATTALVAAYVPARRAAKIEPVRALQYE
jgi:predicted permease